jgi:hypothetical protein
MFNAEDDNAERIDEDDDEEEIIAKMIDDSVKVACKVIDDSIKTSSNVQDEMNAVRPKILLYSFPKELERWLGVLGFLVRRFCEYRRKNGIFAEIESVLCVCAVIAQALVL